MRLIEKFENWLNTNPRKETIAIQCEVIAEDFALSFLDWIMDNCDLSEDRSLYSFESEDYTNARLLEIYKKEKGL